MAVIEAPTDLKARGLTFWGHVVTGFDLSADSMLILAELCRAADRLDALAAVIDSDGVTTVGSRGQIVAHPALSEARAHQAIVARLVTALGLPPEATVALSGARWGGRVAG